ncbi:MAG: sugar phosphate isomerase/epimerase [Clostridiales bacterium]|nr:sugar phosphate isomerase/epimerase [Clostridiales bacterium]
MISTGLVSISFRNLTAREVVDLVVEAKLDGIEWGGDVHVPHGDIKKAREVSKMTYDAGLKIPSYGSYYRTGWDDPKNPEFEAVLETAVALGTPCIRVWAGNRGSSEADVAWWEKVIEDSIEIASMAEKENIVIAFEYHGNTLTDTNESALELIKRIDHPNVKSYWQPPVDQDIPERIEGLTQILPYLAHIHAFQWDVRERLAFKEGFDEWKTYFEIVEGAGKSCYALLEFVKDDEPTQFLEDAQVLKRVLAGV